MCPWGHRFIVPIYACSITCALSFTVLSVWGVLLSFGVLKCFLEAILVFVLTDLEAFCHHLALLPGTLRQTVCPWFFKFFSTASLRSMFNSLLVAFYADSSIFWGFSGCFDSCFGSFEFAFRQDCSRCSSCASIVLTNFGCCVSCRKLPRSSFQRGFSPCFEHCFQVSNGCCQLVFLWSGTLRLPQFVSMFTTTSSACLARSIVVPIMASHVSSVSLDSESLATPCDKVFVVGPGHAPILVKLVKKY